MAAWSWTEEVEKTCSDMKIGQNPNPGDGNLEPGEVQRAEGTSTTADGSPSLDNEYVDAIVDLIPNFGGWQAQLGYSTVKRLGGKVVKLEPTGIVLQPGAEDEEPATEPFKDVWGNTTFQTKKLTGEFAFTREHMRQAREAGVDLATFILMRMAKLMSNNLGELNLNGDEATNPNTRLRRLLSTNNGILKLVQTSGLHNLYPSTTTGKLWDITMYDAMYQAMPKEFKHDGNLVWFQGVELDAALVAATRNVQPSQASAPYGSQGSALGDRALSQRTAGGIARLYGSNPTIVPQMPSDQAGTIGAVTPDSVSAAGGNVTPRVTVAISTIDLSGRKLRVRCIPTGVETIGTIVNDGVNNDCTITGTMGQSVISTTASDYAVSLADMTSAILTNPANFHALIYDEIRAYHRFDQRKERFLFTIHFEHDLVCHEFDAVVMQEGIVAPVAAFNS